MTIFRKPLELVPPLNSLANIARSVINQDYTGDINIIRPPRYWSPTKILSDLSQDEIEDLIDTGRSTAWTKIEMVRTKTATSRQPDGLLTRTHRRATRSHAGGRTAERSEYSTGRTECVRDGKR